MLSDYEARSRSIMVNTRRNVGSFRANIEAVPNHTSHHILNTSANLLGFCLIVLTSLHFTNRTANTVVDEATSGISMMLILSCIFSFTSLRVQNERRAKKLEMAAEYLFLVSLIGILAIVVFITVKYWFR